MRGKLYAWLYPLVRYYWSLFSPNTQGAICVVEHDGHLLMIRNTYGLKQWNFPGGRVKRGESPEATARREIKEEVGLALGELAPLGEIYAGPPEAKRAIVHCHYAKIDHPKIILDTGEILEAQWFKSDQIPSFISPAVPKIMNLIKNRKPAD